MRHPEHGPVEESDNGEEWAHFEEYWVQMYDGGSRFKEDEREEKKREIWGKWLSMRQNATGDAKQGNVTDIEIARMRRWQEKNQPPPRGAAAVDLRKAA